MWLSRNKRKKNNKTLANILLRNYVFSYFIITLLIFVIVIFTLIGVFSFYFNINRFDINNAKVLIKDDYKEINTSEIEALGGYMEIVDSNHNVIYRKGYNPNAKDKYSLDSYNLLLGAESKDNIDITLENNRNKTLSLSDRNMKYAYSSAYNKNKDFLVVTGVPRENLVNAFIRERKVNPKGFLVFILILDFGIIAIVFLFLSRITSRHFIKPLELLTEGAKSLSNGDYSARINIKSENEFGELRDTFNIMAEKIEMEKSLKEKAELNRKKLMLDISHDLRNPLSSILGYSEFILKDKDLTREEIDKYLETIKHNSYRANMLIEDLFEFSKLESSEFRLNLKSLDVCEFLRELIASFIPQFEDKDIDYTFEIPEETVFLLFDNKNLDRAISNLIINAIKYNPPKTEVCIKAEVLKDSFEIIIADNGIGIPIELQKNIFNAFVRTDESRNSEKGGTGLGLAIARRIIEKHHGEIELHSEENKGCKFTIKLPM